MIPFEEAYDRAMASARTLGVERVALADVRGRVLAEPVRADMDMPPFDKSMVDGFACRRADLEDALRVVTTVAAGYAPERAVSAGECAKIMTGAQVPEGADCVFMVEHSETLDGGQVRCTRDDTNTNIAPRGKDVRTGDGLLEPGHRILAQDVGTLAAMGYAEVDVFRRPRVGVIATGDELVEPSGKPSAVQIRNSNGHQVFAQASAMGVEVRYGGIARDNETDLNAKLGALLADCDVVLFSGGVSMGEFDLVPKALAAHGIDIVFDRVAMQPGKPTTFAKSDTHFVFGLPGNPAATFVVFELLAKPFLYRMMGHEYHPPMLRIPLAEDFNRASGGRKAWVPVRLSEDGVHRLAYHGSAHITALSHADGLAPFPEGATDLPAGTLVEVRLIKD